MTHPLQDRVTQLSRRVRRLRWMWAISRVIACAVVAVLVVTMADYLIRFGDPGVRMLASLTALGAVAWASVRYLWPVWQRRSTPLEVARQIERHHPHLEDRLASSLEFLQVSSEHPTAGSRELRESVIRDTTDQLAGVDFGTLVSPYAARRGVGLALVAIAMGAGLFFLNQPMAKLALARLVRPWSDLAWPQRNHLEFRNAPARLATGADFDVELVDRDGADLPGDVKIHFRSLGESAAADKATIAEPIEVASGAMFARRENVTQSFEYRAAGGDDDSMPWLRLDVIDPPRAASIDVMLYPPDYTQWQPYRGERRIRAYQGTRVAIKGELTKPVREVRLHRTDERPLVAKLNEAGDAFAFAEQGESALVVDKSTSYWFEFDDLENDGLVGGRSDRWNIVALTDRQPTVLLEKPSRDLAVVADAVVPLRIVVKDDIRTQAVDLSYRLAQSTDTEVQRLRLMESEQPSSTAASTPAQSGDQHIVKYEWQLADLKLESGAELLIHATAHDFRPQSTDSSVRRIRVVKRAELLEQVASRQAAILSDLARIRQLQIAAREQATALRIQLEEVARAGMGTADRAYALVLSQQQVDRAFDDPNDGVLARIDATLADIKHNRLERDQMAEQLGEVAAEVRRVHGELLPVARGRLNAAREIAQSETSGTATSKIVEPLAAADVAQKQVIDALDRILGEHDQWSGFHQLYRDVSRIKARQEELLKDAEKAGEATIGRRLSQLDPQQKADLKKLAFSQDQLGRQVESARQQLRAAAETAGARGEESADVQNALADAMDLAEQENVAAKMQEASKDLAANRIGSATSTQAASIESLEELLDVLANRRERRLGRMVEKLRSAERELQEIAKRQEQLRKRLSDARKQKDDAKKERELKRLVKEQQAIKAEVEKFARQLKRLAADQASQTAARAGKRMKSAAEAANSGNAGGAASMAQAAKDDLEQAMHELAQRRRAAEMDLAHEQLTSLETVLGQLIARQQALLDATQAIDRLDMAPLDEASQLQVVSLARRQELLREETASAAKRVATLKLVQSTIDRAARQMAAAAGRLRRQETGTEVVRAQRDALRQLGYVMKAVSPGKKSGGGAGTPAGGGSGGSQSGSGSSMNIAELRLVAIVQEQLIGRTTDLEKQRAADEGLTPAHKAEYAELQAQQAELAEWIFRLSEPDDTGPEDRPEEFLPSKDPDEKTKTADPESVDELLPSLFGDD